VKKKKSLFAWLDPHVSHQFYLIETLNLYDDDDDDDDQIHFSIYLTI